MSVDTIQIIDRKAGEKTENPDVKYLSVDMSDKEDVRFEFDISNTDWGEDDEPNRLEFLIMLIERSSDAGITWRIDQRLMFQHGARPKQRDGTIIPHNFGIAPYRLIPKQDGSIERIPETDIFRLRYRSTKPVELGLKMSVYSGKV